MEENNISEAPKAQETSETYTADNIQVLEGLEAVRKRPAMYIGDTGERGLHHLVYEVVDNSIDEALAGFCNNVSVFINEDESITVKDNGRGIPTDYHEKQGKSALEVVLTILHAGGKFNKNSYKVSGGLHGVGVSCVNALSTYFKATIRRDGKIFEQEYSIGKPTTEVKVVGETNETGTEITFKADDSIFSCHTFQYEILAARLRELSFLNKGIRLELTDLRKDEEGNTRNDVFYSKEGLKEFIDYLEVSKDVLSNIIYISTEKNGIPIEVALQYNNSYREVIHSYVNNINTQEGGTHLTGFRRGLTRTLKQYADTSGILVKNKIEISGDDFREGLTAIISVKVQEPLFEGQTKTKLGNTEVAPAVDNAISDALKNYLEENPNDAKNICNKVILAARARIAASNARKLVQQHTQLKGAGLPGKLADCTSRDNTKTEIFIVEGDSAGGTAKQGRDRMYQAILPLRGKILNVEKAVQYKTLDNEEIKNIYTALGITIGTDEDSQAANLKDIRYDKIIIMTDADVDGAHIQTLAMTLFFRYMKEVIDRGHLYLASPPLYLVKHGKLQRYCWTEEQRKQALIDLGNGSEESCTVQRYKGLGEMNAEQLWETTMNPETRTLKQVTIENAAEADRTFSMLMGDDVPPRRDFIEQNAVYANIDA
ncbi:MAG: DNA topoisomerase (ATP-hydrolyzing) subunit B [Bacteroidales bacterium]|nr:DNA topoisomerase (ATP-hydrolyzing) subunit B [Bacteroidales bacterium]